MNVGGGGSYTLPRDAAGAIGVDGISSVPTIYRYYNNYCMGLYGIIMLFPSAYSAVVKCSCIDSK